MVKTIDPESSLAKKYGIHVIAYHVMKGETPVEIFNHQLKCPAICRFRKQVGKQLKSQVLLYQRISPFWSVVDGLHSLFFILLVYVSYSIFSETMLQFRRTMSPNLPPKVFTFPVHDKYFVCW